MVEFMQICNKNENIIEIKIEALFVLVKMGKKNEKMKKKGLCVVMKFQCVLDFYLFDGDKFVDYESGEFCGGKCYKNRPMGYKISVVIGS